MPSAEVGLVLEAVLLVSGVIACGLGWSTSSDARQVSDSSPVQISARTEDEMRAKLAQADENTRRVEELSARADRQKLIGGLLTAAGAVVVVAFLSGRLQRRHTEPSASADGE